MTTEPRVIVTRPAGPDGPPILAVYGDMPAPIVAVPLTPRRALRLCCELLAAVEPGEVEAKNPLDKKPTETD